MLLSGSLRREGHLGKTPLVIFHIIGRSFKYIRVWTKSEHVLSFSKRWGWIIITRLRRGSPLGKKLPASTPSTKNLIITGW